MLTKEELRKKFDEKLKTFDRFYCFADDSKAYNNGKAQYLVLRGLAVQIGMSPEEFEKLTGNKM